MSQFFGRIHDRMSKVLGLRISSVLCCGSTVPFRVFAEPSFTLHNSFWVTDFDTIYELDCGIDGLVLWNL